MVDFSAIERPLDWFEKVGPYDFAKMAVKPEGRVALLDRCARFTAFIAARPEESLICVAHHTFFTFLLELEFANCEVMELALHADSTWSVLTARDEVRPLFLKNGERLTMGGCPPLSGTAKESLFA